MAFLLPLAIEPMSWNKRGGTQSRTSTTRLQETSFLAEMKGGHLDMILINENMESSFRDEASTMPLLSANFVLPDEDRILEYLQHFFYNRRNLLMDPRQGPKGFLLFVIIQLLITLDARNCPSLDF
ncbi:hypothetical protein F5X97DRAFT_341975 [Nemania serpens]|nr:hypothetical protein F5X97DRAFT_341975 [Nemania serpens]